MKRAPAPSSITSPSYISAYANVTAASQRDYTLVMGVVLVYSVLIIAANFAADLLYRVLDPRTRAT